MKKLYVPNIRCYWYVIAKLTTFILQELFVLVIR